LRGVVTEAEGLADTAHVLTLPETQQQELAVGFAEAAQRGVNDRRRFVPEIVGGGGIHGIQVRGVLLPPPPAGLRADDTESPSAGRAMQPCGERPAIPHGGRFCRERGEDGLHHILGEAFVRGNAQSGGKDETGVSLHEFAKGTGTPRGGVGL
jgi:hypothetical protein